MITRENYEIYVIDYLDGSLSPSLESEFKAFLLAHPELEEELEELKQVKLTPPPVTYPHKDLLKKTEEQECPDYYAIAMAENVLSAEEQRQVGPYRSDKKFQESVRMYKKLRLLPDTRIVYPSKSKLYRKNYRRLWLAPLTAAAGLALLLTLGTPLFHTAEYALPRTLAATRTLELPEPVVMAPASRVLELPDTPLIPRRKKRILSAPPAPAAFFAQTQPLLVPVNTETEPSLNRMVPVTSTIAEINLTEDARAWKSSTSNFQSRNIFTSVIHAGKNLAEKIKKEK